MKALVFKRYGGPDQVTFADVPRPVPKPDEILVQVHAAGLNPVDNKIREGKMKPLLRFQLPATLGSDLAGVVLEVGRDVTRFKPGDAVLASIFGLRTGALAEFGVVPEKVAALKPANLDFVQAASIPMVGLTAWQALKERAHLKPGHKVFIPAGAGGIGTVISLVGPPDAAFGRTRGMNSLVLFVLWLLSRKVHRLAKKRDVDYSFLFVHPDGSQLAEIGELLKVGIIRPVIDKVFPFGQVKEALAYLEKGRAKGKVVVQIR